MKTFLSFVPRAEYVLLLLVACLLALLLDDRYGYLSYPNKISAFSASLMIIGAWVCLEFTLFVFGLFSKPGRQYSIRWIMLGVVAAAITTATFQHGENRAAAYKGIDDIKWRLSEVDGNPRRIRDDEEYELSMLTYETINGHKELTSLNFCLEETDCGC